MADTVTVETPPCFSCEMASKITMPREAYDRWQAGEHIQTSWRDGTPEEREMLLTGWHPDCWDAAFPEED